MRMFESNGRAGLSLKRKPQWALILTVLFASNVFGSVRVEVQRASCRIQNQLNGSLNVGSGTLVDRTSEGREGLVLTCAHLFREGSGRIVVSFPKGKQHLGKLVAIDHQADLAALAIGNPAVPPVAMALGSFPQGNLAACGYGSSGAFRTVEGPVIGQAGDARQQSAMISGAVRSGDSGGGVFDPSGRLVAVVWGEADGVTYASCGAPLEQFLHRVLGERITTASTCPGGVCPRQPAESWRPGVRPLPSTPSDPASTRWQELLKRVEALEKNTDRCTNCVTPSDVESFVRKSDLAKYVTNSRFRQLQQQIAAYYERLTKASDDDPDSLPWQPEVKPLNFRHPALWGLLLSTVIGAWLLGKHKKPSRGAGGRRRDPFPQPSEGGSRH